MGELWFQCKLKFKKKKEIKNRKTQTAAKGTPKKMVIMTGHGEFSHR